MSLSLRTLLISFALLLTACETLPEKQDTTVWDDPLWQKQYQALKTIKGFTTQGRIGITQPDDSFSSSIMWKQQSRDTLTIRMYGTFGTTYALLDITPHLTTLKTGDEQHFEGYNAEQLLYDVLGWNLPIHYLQDWVLGLPTGIHRDDLKINADGTLQELNYQDYQVLFQKYDSHPWQHGHTISLPQKIRITQGENKIILSLRSWDLIL